MAEFGTMEIKVRGTVRIREGLYLTPMAYDKIERVGNYVEFHREGKVDQYWDADKLILRQLEDMHGDFIGDDE